VVFVSIKFFYRKAVGYHKKVLFSVLFLSGALFGAELYAQKTVLFLGDSLTAGYGVELREAFPAIIQEKFNKSGRGNIKIINAGISGSTTASAYGRLRWYLKIKPDIVFLALGANDGLRGLNLKEMEGNLEKTIQLAHDNQIRVILAGMKMPPNYGKKYTRDFEEVFVKLSKRHKLSFVSFLLKDVAARPELNIGDGIHPNPKGHQIIAETILKTLLPLLD